MKWRRSCTSVLAFGLSACGAPSASDNPSKAEPRMKGVDEAAELIEAHGYFSWGDATTDERGVRVHDPDAAYPGYNFCYHPDFPEAYLMDMEGNFLHRWIGKFSREFPKLKDKPKRGNVDWRRARLLDDGSIIAIYEGYGMVRLANNSDVMWAVPNKAHHDLDFDGRGNFYVLCRESQMIPRVSDVQIYTDYVRQYTLSGDWLDSISIDAAYEASEYPPPLESDHRRAHKREDLYHTNTLTVLDGTLQDRHPGFAKGNLLLSFRSSSEIAVLDPTARKIVWVTRGPWYRQHEPVVLHTGRMLIFDNYGENREEVETRILEFDPFSLEIFWSYRGPPEAPLKSRICGSVSRLPNGNTLISESDGGRALEITSDERVVWEFVFDLHEDDDSLRVGKLMEMVRVDPERVESWLDTE